MKKKALYIAPKSETVRLRGEQVLTTASPGVDDGSFDPNEPAEAKEGDTDGWPRFNPWEKWEEEQ